MRDRCTNQNSRSWERYGGRGVEFRFASVRECVEHLKTLPDCCAELEVDRQNNDGHYKAGNLRFVTRAQQLSNRRNTARVQTESGPVLLAEWPSPYSIGTTFKYAVTAGMNSTQIVAMAQEAVRAKRKNWRAIAARLVGLGYTT